MNRVLIREIVKQALSTGYLTIAAENQLRQLLRNQYDLEDLDAFLALQQAAMAGLVKQESRESKHIEKSLNLEYKKAKKFRHRKRNTVRQRNGKSAKTYWCKRIKIHQNSKYHTRKIVSWKS